MQAHNDTAISNYIESRLTKLETTQENINLTLVRMERKIDDLDKKMDAKFEVLDKKIDTKFELLDKKIDNKFELLDSKSTACNNRIWFNFYWMIGAFAANYVLLAKLLHWIQ